MYTANSTSIMVPTKPHFRSSSIISMADLGSQPGPSGKKANGKSKSSKPLAQKNDGKGPKESKIKGVHVQSYGFERNSALMAGYLGLKDTDSLRTLMAQSSFQEIVQQWATARRAHIGVEGASEAAKELAARVQRAQILKLARDNLFQHAKRQPNQPILADDIPSSFLPTVCWLNAIVRILEANTAVFSKDEDGEFANEDINHGYMLLCWYWKTQTDSRKKSNANCINCEAVIPKYNNDSEDEGGPSSLTAVKEDWLSADIPGNDFDNNNNNLADISADPQPATNARCRCDEVSISEICME